MSFNFALSRGLWSIRAEIYDICRFVNTYGFQHINGNANWLYLQVRPHVLMRHAYRSSLMRFSHIFLVYFLFESFHFEFGQFHAIIFPAVLTTNYLPPSSRMRSVWPRFDIVHGQGHVIQQIFCHDLILFTVKVTS